MSTTMQLSEIRTAVRQRADMVNSQFVTDSELTSYINQSYFELYDLLVQKYGDNYYVAPSLSITTDGTNQLFNLPDGTLYSSAPACYKLLGVDLLIGGGSNGWVTLKQINFSERNRYSAPYAPAVYAWRGLRYRLHGSQILFEPLPAAGLTIRLWYIPRMTTLANDSDVVDGISGWTEYIIVDAATKCMQKEESDCSMLLAQKQALINRIENAAENRDVGSPATVSDSRLSESAYPYSGGMGEWGDW